jgi:hypothetical protein
MIIKIALHYRRARTNSIDSNLS